MKNSSDPVFKAWAESAALLDKHREARRLMFYPITEALCREGGVPEAPPVTVFELLDVASGPGEAALDIAESLGPNVTVWCTDLVPDMVRIAAASAEARGIANARFHECPAESLPFDAGFFNAVICQFGIMFFRDPEAGIREALRVLKPGGRVAYCVWGTRAANPIHRVIQDVLDRYFPAAPVDLDQPGAYRFSPPGKLLRLMRIAGAVQVSERLLNIDIQAPLSFDEFFEVRTAMSDSLRDKLRRMGPVQAASFKEEVRMEARDCITSAGFRFPAEVLLVSGARA